MFDVIWTDPNRESVGERKQRKKKESDTSSRNKENNKTLRNSSSTHSSTSSGEKPFGVFGNTLSKKKSDASTHSKRPASSRAAVPALPTTPVMPVIKTIPSAFIHPPPSLAPTEGVSFRDSIFGGGELSQIATSNGYPHSHFGGRVEGGAHSLAELMGADLSENSPPGLDSKASIFSKWTDPGPMPATPVSAFEELHLHHQQPGAKSQLVQALGPSSFITKTTEVIVAPRSSDLLDGEHLSSDVTITADPRAHVVLPPPSTPPSPKEQLPKSIQTKNWLYSIPNRTRSLSPPQEEAAATRMALAGAASGSGGPPPTPPPPMPPVSRAPSSPQTPTNNSHHTIVNTTNRTHRIPNIPAPSAVFRNENPDAWRPPDAWDCPPPAAAAATRKQSLPVCVTASLDAAVVGYRTEEQPAARKSGSMSLDLIAMQREMKMMDAASSQTVLARLQEEWGDSTAADPALCREVEMEKKRWMLSAMYNINRLGMDEYDTPVVAAAATSGSGSGPGSASGAGKHKEKEKEKDLKILALFESQATASYLAAAHCDCFIYHMSPDPISNDLFPNVLPTTLPIASHLALSTAPDMFSAVYCLSLPSMSPSSEIPPLLRSIRRTLRPGGSLHITLIDPSPVGSCMGPRFRQWYEENLQLNLERKFRCVSPRKLFPGWLSDARLRGGGSTITTIKFFAVTPLPQGSGSGDGSSVAPDDEYCASSVVGAGAGAGAGGCGTGNGSISGSVSVAGSRADRDVRTELRSVVGRMLWKEVWGKYVSVGKWWWEDPLIVQECHEMSTFWEYNLIQAAKED